MQLYCNHNPIIVVKALVLSHEVLPVAHENLDTDFRLKSVGMHATIKGSWESVHVTCSQATDLPVTPPARSPK